MSFVWMSGKIDWTSDVKKLYSTCDALFATSTVRRPPVIHGVKVMPLQL